MEDVQSRPSGVPLDIDRVGVKDLRLPLVVRDRESGTQHIVARVDLSVDLPAEFKGTHMSRFVDALESWSEGLDYASLRNLFSDIIERLKARRAYARFSFPYFLRQTSPVSRCSGLMGYDCAMNGRFEDGRITFTLEVRV
ncbi:MAG: GTP cyclohydrolase, FolE2/MptA family, partial [Desulfovibrionaceae bacterium]|nr:GTP cyclohydrolase, FolE2/MptA family [Desulfovibrionaceae bacterium]